MTNNPTIDGVSRRMLTALLCHVSEFENRALVDELRALLDADIPASVAPAVERQEPLSFDPALISAGPDGVSKLERLQATCEGLDSQNDSLADEVAALQSTIAQLQARIAELESGRGEPVAWLTNGGRLFYFASSNIEPLPTDQPLYTVPPVAVVLPERKERCPATGMLDYGSAQWNACLDATAALNGVPK